MAGIPKFAIKTYYLRSLFDHHKTAIEPNFERNLPQGGFLPSPTRLCCYCRFFDQEVGCPKNLCRFKAVEVVEKVGKIFPRIKPRRSLVKLIVCVGFRASREWFLFFSLFRARDESESGFTNSKGEQKEILLVEFWKKPTWYLWW